MEELPRISGCPLVEKLSMGHILNTKAVGRMYGANIGRRYEDLNLIIVHTGGGISIGLHKKGVIADILTDEDGTMSPERAGGLPSIGMAKLCFRENILLTRSAPWSAAKAVWSPILEQIMCRKWKNGLERVMKRPPLCMRL